MQGRARAAQSAREALRADLYAQQAISRGELAELQAALTGTQDEVARQEVRLLH